MSPKHTFINCSWSQYEKTRIWREDDVEMEVESEHVPKIVNAIVQEYSDNSEEDDEDDINF